MRFVTCPACGGVGHVTRGGLCSRSALAEASVRSGEMTAPEAAGHHRVSVTSVYQRLRRSGAMAATWSSFDRLERIMVAARRREVLWGGRNRSSNNTVADPLPWPDPAEPPMVDARGSDHAELPDPPRLAGVGWRTARR